MMENRQPQSLFDEALALQVLRSVQNLVPIRDRSLFADHIVEQTNKLVERRASSGRVARELEELRRSGIVRATVAPRQERCKEILNYFSTTPCYPAHVAAYSTGDCELPQDISTKSNYGSYKIEQSLMAPGLLEFAMSDDLIELATEYIGCTPTLYSINTFWTFPSKTYGATHDYHRDQDDFRFLAVFVYWTNVTPGDGEFYYIPRTHDTDYVENTIRNKKKKLFPNKHIKALRDIDHFRRLDSGNGYHHGKLYRRLFTDGVLCLTGPAGTTFVADTFGLHKGSPPGSKPRLVSWIRFGLYANTAYMWDKTHPIAASRLTGYRPQSERDRYICRLLVRPD